MPSCPHSLTESRLQLCSTLDVTVTLQTLAFSGFEHGKHVGPVDQLPETSLAQQCAVQFGRMFTQTLRCTTDAKTILQLESYGLWVYDRNVEEVLDGRIVSFTTSGFTVRTVWAGDFRRTFTYGRLTMSAYL